MEWVCLELLKEDRVCVASPLYMLPLQGWSWKLTGSQKPLEGHGKCSPVSQEGRKLSRGRAVTLMFGEL